MAGFSSLQCAIAHSMLLLRRERPREHRLSFKCERARMGILLPDSSSVQGWPYPLSWIRTSLRGGRVTYRSRTGTATRISTTGKSFVRRPSRRFRPPPGAGRRLWGIGGPGPGWMRRRSCRRWAHWPSAARMRTRKLTARSPRRPLLLRLRPPWLRPRLHRQRQRQRRLALPRILEVGMGRGPNHRVWTSGWSPAWLCRRLLSWVPCC
mmetsp:Transcript_27880/g.73549  ORF Transcript_27880/g.73549 Transcript_27880/m.73549 type:complete len:208 (+) Transcript_27880:646-1269(+)